MKTSDKSLQEAIIELYLNVKIRKQEDLDKFEQNNLEKEREKLIRTNPLLILDYIKSSIEILINMKVQEKLQAFSQSRSMEEVSETEANVYEKELRHLEAEIRSHIRIEHQQKLHIENLQSSIDELEQHREELKNKLKSYQEQLGKFKEVGEKDYVEALQKENTNLKQIIKSYEERNISITELERKIREKQAKHERELKELETKYKEKLKQLNKKLKNEDSTRALITRDNNNHRITDITVENNQLTDRGLARNTSISGITDRKKEDYNSHAAERKKDSSGKRLSENMKNIIDDLKSKKDCSFLVKKKVEKEVSEDISMNISNINAKNNDVPNKHHTRTDSHAKLTENSSSKLILTKLNNNKHTRNCSFDNKKQLTQNNNTGNKKIHTMKDLASTQNYKSNNTQKLVPSQTMTPSMIAGKSNNATPNNYIPTGNVMINQSAVPCFNNINIYTSNMNNFKTNEINLKQYIINKMNSKSKGKQHHSRTTSTTAVNH